MILKLVASRKNNSRISMSLDSVCYHIYTQVIDDTMAETGGNPPPPSPTHESSRHSTRINDGSFTLEQCSLQEHCRDNYESLNMGVSFPKLLFFLAVGATPHTIR